VKINYRLNANDVHKQYILVLLLKGAPSFQEQKNKAVLPIFLLVIGAMAVGVAAKIILLPLLLFVLALIYIALHLMFLGDLFTKRFFEKNAKKLIEDAGNSLIDKTFALELTDVGLLVIGPEGENDYPASSIRRFMILKDYFLWEFDSEEFILVPKEAFEDPNMLVDRMKSMDVDGIEHLAWDWKESLEF
jgi:hypothetical protein